MKGADRRELDKLIYRFIEINNAAFEFLEVNAIVSSNGSEIGLYLSSSKYVGSVPIKSPYNGKIIGDLIVMPRYFDNRNNELLEIIEYVNPKKLIEYNNSLQLKNDNRFELPRYIIAAKFIAVLSDFSPDKWYKFSSCLKYQLLPKGKIDFKKLATRSSDPIKRIKIPTNVNSLSAHHTEVSMLKYAYLLAKSEIDAVNVPNLIKHKYNNIISKLDKKFYNITPVKATKLKHEKSDSIIIKNVKNAANEFLYNTYINNNSWRIDFEILFEKYIQAIFSKLCKLKGYKIYNNKKIMALQSNTNLSLKYIEPDILIRTEHNIFTIDAKYKSHIFNLNNSNKALKEEHRRDIHQIIAYSAFNNSINKTSILAYPSNKVFYKTINYVNDINGCNVKVYLLGIPISKNQMPNIIDKLTNLLDQSSLR